METEPTASASSRPRPFLLILLGLAVVALVLVKFMPSGSATPGRATSNQARPAATVDSDDRIDPQDLNVRIEELTTPRPEPAGADRNPFRFQPKPPPPPPPTAVRPPGGPEGGGGAGDPPPPPVDLGPPPIPLKFIGLIEGQGKKLAALSDCKFTYRGEEGEIIEGRYRLVKIGVESIVMEYVDGRGRTTIRLSGDCPGR
jgi:hypothetical protein